MAELDRDLWWEARQKSAGYRGQPVERLIRFITYSLPGRPTRQSMLAFHFGTEEGIRSIDLNVYRPNCPVEALMDIDPNILWILRVTHPTRWVYGQEGWTVDSTFPAYYERIKRKNSKAKICGYHVHSHWVAEMDYEHNADQANMFKEATANHPLDLYALDDEVGEIWKDGKTTYVTNTNCVRAVSNEIRRFSNLRKHSNGLPIMCLHYSAIWYMKKYGSSTTYKPSGPNSNDMREYATWLDNANRDPENLQAPPWRAYYPNQFSQRFNTPYDLQSAIATPTGTQENAYLNGCTNGKAVLWQALSTALFPGMDVGVDFSIGYGYGQLRSDFFRRTNVPVDEGTPPPPPPDDGGGDTGNTSFEQWLEGTYKTHVHALPANVTGTPQ